MLTNSIKSYISEYLGTFILVFAGTGAIIINDVSDGTITHVGIALTFGLVVATAIYAYGDNSGAHINPAVTIGFWLAKRFPGKNVIPYIISQILGATTASFVLSLLFPEHKSLGATYPSGTAFQSFILELILTWWLMSVILEVADGAKKKGLVAGLVIGSVVALEALFAGPISGASMNPARSLGPTFITGNFSHIWVYIVATILGSILAVISHCVVRVNIQD